MRMFCFHICRKLAAISFKKERAYHDNHDFFGFSHLKINLWANLPNLNLYVECLAVLWWYQNDNVFWKEWQNWFTLSIKYQNSRSIQTSLLTLSSRNLQTTQCEHWIQLMGALEYQEDQNHSVLHGICQNLQMIFMINSILKWLVDCWPLSLPLKYLELLEQYKVC